MAIENKLKSIALKGALFGLATLAFVCLSECSRDIGKPKYHISVYSNDGKLVLSKDIIDYYNTLGNKVDCLTEDRTTLKVNGTYVIEAIKK